MRRRDIVIRPIDFSQLEAAHRLELACYIPEAAATLPAFEFRQRHFPRYFLAACEGNDPDAPLIGLTCGVRTSESDCAGDGVKGDRDPQTDGRHLCVLSVAVREDCRRSGIGAALMTAMLRQAETDGLDSVILMCEPHLIGFYERLGFAHKGVSPSGHAGIVWHEMKRELGSRTAQ